MQNYGKNKSQPLMPKCPPLELLKGQKALVTGGESGIGKSIAIALGNAGCDVVVNYIKSEEAANEVVSEVQKSGSKSLAYKADVSDEKHVQEMFKAMYERFGTIDILVNNAGVENKSPFSETSLEDWKKVININLTGAFLCSREAVKEFKNRGVKEEISCSSGKIIFISSVHDIIPWAGYGSYTASKAGMNMLMKTIAQEEGPNRVRANSISPGATKTPINKDAWCNPEGRKKMLELIPYNRLGETEDIARVTVWLASDHSDYITGTTIYVDGGMTLYPGFATGG